MRTALLAAALALALLAGCSEAPAGKDAGRETAAAETAAASEPESEARRPAAIVARVLDGDTIRLASGREVRLVQIDAPELGARECYAGEARGVLATLLPAGTRVRLAADPRLDAVDDYGRLLRYVFRGSQNVNLALVRRGAATVWFYGGERGRYADALLRAARQARAAERGLWGACPGTPFDPLHPAATGAAQPPAAGTCPGAISWRRAKEHAGGKTTVKGPVAGAVYAAETSGQPTFLNLGVDYPDPDRFTAIIWGRDRHRFREPPEQAYAGKTICVTGRIELYEGVAEIEVSSPGQIEAVG